MNSYRYNMYVVFMSVPSGLVRSLATKRMNLTEDGDEEEDDGLLMGGGGGQGRGPEREPGPKMTARRMAKVGCLGARG